MKKEILDQLEKLLPVNDFSQFLCDDVLIDDIPLPANLIEGLDMSSLKHYNTSNAGNQDIKE